MVNNCHRVLVLANPSFWTQVFFIAPLAAFFIDWPERSPITTRQTVIVVTETAPLLAPQKGAAQNVARRDR
jgi:hypothetical protein